MNIIVGTAGHIDHGKTALVKALTGVDADRFPEEKKRGITIDIGFAELDLGEIKIGFVDVPGHERFVKNMLAGAHGIDAVALVVAADEGVMPQTREHFDICRLLSVRNGVVVLTKTDLVDGELLEIAEMDVSELIAGSFLEGAPIISVSAKTGHGIDELKKELQRIALEIPARKNEKITRLPIDRSFSMKGFGAVVTGTLISGEISEGDELEIMPDRIPVRTRGVQTHGKSVKTASAGQRTAINLGGIETGEIARGMILAERSSMRPTHIVDVELDVLDLQPIKNRRRVRIHLGTVEALGRIHVLNETGVIAKGQSDFAQLRLEIPVAAVLGDRLIIRSYSPQITIAGGRVLDSTAVKHRKRSIEKVRSFLTELSTFENDPGRSLELFIEKARRAGTELSDLKAQTGWKTSILQKAVNDRAAAGSIVEADRYFLSSEAFQLLEQRTLELIADFHDREPLAKGISRETLREKLHPNLPAEIFKAVLAGLEKKDEIRAKDVVMLSSHDTELTGEDSAIFDRLKKIYATAGFEPPKLDEALADAGTGTKRNAAHIRKIFQLLLDQNEVAKISEEFYFKREKIDELVAKLQDFAQNSADRLIDVAEFKEIAGVSRKYAIPLLEYFDREAITRRAGDKRLIMAKK
ncbi:MAG: selenocysteine-specific translation elongation factor [Pyrinomonadaceae bacterium]|nr:selenocysteine-specific translation elongation factor [Pyrinomonadaceae bacterium]